MAPYKVSFLALVLLLLAGCAKDDNLTNDKVTADTNPALLKAQIAVNDAVAELEADYFSYQNSTEEISNRSFVFLPPGSINGLAAAIEEAGPGGTVFVQAGKHYESSPIVITFPVFIFGEPGSIIYFDLEEPSNDATAPVKPAFHLINVVNARLQSLEIYPADEKEAMLAVLAEKCKNTWIADLKLKNFLTGIFMDDSDDMRVYGNKIIGTETGVGIGLSDGYNTKIRGNVVSNFQSGILPVGQKGIAFGNETHDCEYGIIFSGLSEIVLPSGTVAKTTEAATEWTVKDNNSHHNDWGYALVGGANNNYVFDNAASENKVYDIELADETDRFDPEKPLPPSHDNVVKSDEGDFKKLVIKRCGLNNLVIGGKLVDNLIDACF